MGTPARTVFERAARIFCLLETLGKACGYTDAPFTKLIEEILSHRDRVANYRLPIIPELAR